MLRNKKRLFLAVVSLLSIGIQTMPLCAQNDLASFVTKTQAALKDFSCPAGASPQACSDFQKMVADGSQVIAGQFSPMFDDQRKFPYIIYLVFDNQNDEFWIISAKFAHSNNVGLVIPNVGLVIQLITYGHYITGTLVTGSVNKYDIPMKKGAPTVFNSTDAGVTVSLFENGSISMSSKETKTFKNGDTAEIDIQVMKTEPYDLPLADVTISVFYQGQKSVYTGKAVKFISPHLNNFSSR